MCSQQIYLFHVKQGYLLKTAVRYFGPQLFEFKILSMSICFYSGNSVRGWTTHCHSITGH